MKTMYKIYNNYHGKGLGAQIKAIREEMNESQAEMAKYRFHKSTAWLSQVELGKRIPKVKDLECLEILGYQAMEIDGEVRLVNF